MNTKARDSLIGLTAIAGLLLLSWMLLSFGELSGLGQQYHTLAIRAPTARGVSSVSPVSLNGVRIGDVTDIELAADGSGEAIIRIRYGQGVRIPADFRLFLDAGLMGSASLDFVTDPGPHTEFVQGEGEEYTREVASLIDSLAAEVSTRFERFDQTVDKIDALAETYTDVGQRLAGVIDSGDPEADDLKKAMAQIGDLAARWNSMAATIAEHTAHLSAQGSASLENLDAAVVSLHQVAGEARDVAARINRGEGTLGQLSTNTDLFRSLDATVRQLQALIKDGQLLIEKFRDEGVPINL